MTPHPTTLKAARAINGVESTLYPWVVAADAQLIEESCHVSELVAMLADFREALRLEMASALEHSDIQAAEHIAIRLNPVESMLRKVTP